MERYLFLIKSEFHVNPFEYYDSAVVCAESPAQAARIHPDGDYWDDERGQWQDHEDEAEWWPDVLELVDVKRIGVAERHVQIGVICSSFIGRDKI